MNPRAGFGPFLAVLAAVVVARLWLAGALPLFGDEAFYWLEGRHLAPAYSDLPFVTAALTVPGSWMLPDAYLGVRLSFLMLGLLTPLLVWRVAREVGSPNPWWAALASLCMPLLTINGVLALPEVPLVFFTLLFTLGALRLLRSDAAGGAWLAGLGAALGLSTHYRFAVVLAGAVVFLLASARGRALLRRPRLWLSVGLAALGLVPMVWFNLTHDFSAVKFQLLERHPWSFQAEALLQPLLQVLVVTPVLFGALVLALVHGVRRARAGDAAHGLLVALAVVPLAVFLILGLWADQERSSFHWPLLGYLPLLVLLPEAMLPLGVAARRLVRWGVPLLGLAGAGVLFVYLAMAATPRWLEEHAMGKSFPANFLGWPQAAGRTAARLRPGEALIADNFMLGAELSFELHGRLVDFVLDNPLNARHGRQVQLEIWGMSEFAMGAQDTVAGLLVVEATAVEFIDRPDWLRRMCDVFTDVRWLDELALFQGRKRFLYFRVSRTGQSARCQLPSFAWLDEPRPDTTLSAPTLVRGWAFNDAAGVKTVQLLVDGTVRQTLAYGRPHAGVKHVFPGSTDPAHPDVGFGGRLDVSGLSPGAHRIGIRVIAKDGTERDLEQRTVYVGPAR